MPKKNKASKKPNLNNIKNKLSLSKKANQKTAVWTAVLLALVLFGVSGWFWWTRVFTDADRVFADMLAKNLSTQSVTRKVAQKDQSSSVDQTIYVSFRPPEIISRTRSVLSEKGADRQTTTVTTETIGTKNDDFVRYVSAEGTEDLAVAGNLDNVLGVWSKRSGDANFGGTAFLNEAAFSLVPFGNLSPEKRRELLNFINDKNVYQLSQAKRSFVDGRYVYVYNVSVDPVALVESLAKYVELTGVGDVSQLNPASFEGAAPVNLTMTVDIASRQLLSLDFPATGRTETIESRGTYHEIELPENAIPFEELQNRLLGQPSANNAEGENSNTRTQ